MRTRAPLASLDADHADIAILVAAAAAVAVAVADVDVNVAAVRATALDVVSRRVDMDFAQLEETDGTRWTWHFWPSSRLDASRCVVPFASMYTPLKEVADAPVLPYGPVVSRDGAVLNPYCNVDFRARMWVCPFTFQRNQLPPQYADISDTNLPAELLPQHTVVEYKLPRQPAPPPAFLFVLDTSLREDQLEVAKEYVMKSLTLLPPEAAVGLITFGQMCTCTRLGSPRRPSRTCCAAPRTTRRRRCRRCSG